MYRSSVFLPIPHSEFVHGYLLFVGLFVQVLDDGHDLLFFIHYCSLFIPHILYGMFILSCHIRSQLLLLRLSSISLRVLQIYCGCAKFWWPAFLWWAYLCHWGSDAPPLEFSWFWSIHIPFDSVFHQIVSDDTYLNVLDSVSS